MITHFHLDHWGDLIPWVFGSRFGPGRNIAPVPELWLPPGGSETLRGFTSKLSADPLFDAFDVREYAGGTPFRAAGFEVVATRVPHYDLLDVRAAGDRRRADARLLGRLRALAGAGRGRARCRPLPLRGHARRAREPALRGHLTEQEALAAYRASGAKRLLIVHRPDELPLEEAPELARDGYETTV